MRTVTKEYEVYSFNELSPGAQDKALEQLSDINVDYYWHYLEAIEDVADDIGIKVNMKDICFELDSGACVYFDQKDISIASPERLIKALVQANIIDKKYTKHLMKYADVIFTIVTKHYSGGDGRNYLSINDEGNILPTDTEDKIDTWFEENFTEKLLSILRQEYDYRTSREAIVEAIEANEYEFLKDGKIFSQ